MASNQMRNLVRFRSAFADCFLFMRRTCERGAGGAQQTNETPKAWRGGYQIDKAQSNC